MGFGPRLPFVPLPRETRLFRRFSVRGYRCDRPCDHLVEVRDAPRCVDAIRARRIGCRTWTYWSRSVFLKSHKEIKVKT